MEHGSIHSTSYFNINFDTVDTQTTCSNNKNCTLSFIWTKKIILQYLKNYYWIEIRRPCCCYYCRFADIRLNWFSFLLTTTEQNIILSTEGRGWRRTHFHPAALMKYRVRSLSVCDPPPDDDDICHRSVCGGVVRTALRTHTRVVCSPLALPTRFFTRSIVYRCTLQWNWSVHEHILILLFLY